MGGEGEGGGGVRVVHVRVSAQHNTEEQLI